MHDPTLLEGLKKAFPNLESLTLKTCRKEGDTGAVSGMEVGVVLKACTGSRGRLRRLNVKLPAYPGQMMDFIKVLLDSRDLFQGECQL